MEAKQQPQVQKAYNFRDTQATRKIFQLRKRIRAVAGGTSASKTISILFWIIDYCQVKQSRDKLVSVVSESHPHLEKGAILDFQNIMKDRGYWDEARWNQTRHTYKFETGNILEFYSVELGKAHGPRRDVLFVNECNNLEFNVVDQLITRTRETIWLDWNPSVEFWFYTDMQGKRDDIDFITLTYKDNDALDESIIKEIESHQQNKHWWSVYGLGQLGEAEGRIYKDWKIIEEIPHEARLERRGLDFGYSNDPAAIVDVYFYNGGYILDERLYRKGYLNKQIADFINALPDPGTMIIADSAEPKSIDELRLYGLNILPAEKGSGSINTGIDFVQSQRISVTQASVNLIKEYRNYVWQSNRADKLTRTPEGGMDHCMDALRYAMQGLRPTVVYNPRNDPRDIDTETW